MVIIVRKCYQKSVDMGQKLEENMYGWVGFFISGPHTPVTFLVKYPPRDIFTLVLIFLFSYIET